MRRGAAQQQKAQPSNALHDKRLSNHLQEGKREREEFACAHAVAETAKETALKLMSMTSQAEEPSHLTHRAPKSRTLQSGAAAADYSRDAQKADTAGA